MEKTKQVQIIAANTKRLMKTGDWNLSSLSKDSHVDHGTISKLLSDYALPNPTTKIITGLANSFKVAPWMLMIENFPFDSLGNRQPLTQISTSGYMLLELYESASEEKRKSLLDYVAYQLRADPKAEHKIREAQTKYLLTNDGKYPRCNEDYN